MRSGPDHVRTITRGEKGTESRSTTERMRRLPVHAQVAHAKAELIAGEEEGRIRSGSDGAEAHVDTVLGQPE